MKKTFLVLAMSAFIIGCKDDPKSQQNIEVESIDEPKLEDKVDWVFLFDGTSFDNWNEYLSDGVSDHWKIEDGAMVFYPPIEREKGKAYNLVTKKEYTDFELSIDWRISEAGNSGIFWGVKEDPNLPVAYQTGPEIQVLDNEKHPDAKAGTTHQAGALYDMISPLTDATNNVGEWNTFVIMVNHKTNSGSVALNEKEIVTFPVNNPEWEAMVAKSKFATWEHFGKYTTGKIGLQDHGDKVSYRNIKIKEL